MRYTESGIPEPDNNRLERAIRPIAVGRANFMFVGSPRGERAAATMYSLLVTCRLNGIEPYAWLKDALERCQPTPSAGSTNCYRCHANR